MSVKLILNLVGWLGAGLVLLGYGLVTFEIISSSDMLFQLLNFAGALSLATISWYKKSYQLVVLNIVWAVIALTATVQIFVY